MKTAPRSGSMPWRGSIPDPIWVSMPKAEPHGPSRRGGSARNSRRPASASATVRSPGGRQQSG
jgi:hypothetical protein